MFFSVPKAVAQVPERVAPARRERLLAPAAPALPEQPPAQPVPQRDRDRNLQGVPPLPPALDVQDGVQDVRSVL